MKAFHRYSVPARGRVRRPTPAVFLALTLAVASAGCAVTSQDGERLPLRSDAFADYVESVFRRQNELADRLALTLDAADPGSSEYAALEDAELGLFAACRGLNELARSRRDGEPIEGLGAFRRARQAPECEDAADIAASLLGPD